MGRLGVLAAAPFSLPPEAPLLAHRITAGVPWPSSTQCEHSHTLPISKTTSLYSDTKQAGSTQRRYFCTLKNSTEFLFLFKPVLTVHKSIRIRKYLFGTVIILVGKDWVHLYLNALSIASIGYFKSDGCLKYRKMWILKKLIWYFKNRQTFCKWELNAIYIYSNEFSMPYFRKWVYTIFFSCSKWL